MPVFCGSALKNKGVQFLLDGVIDYLPSPLDIPAVKATDPKNNEIIERKADDTAPFTALAFKVASDPFVGKLCFFRVYSGKIAAGSYVLNTTTGRGNGSAGLFVCTLISAKKCPKFTPEKSPQRWDLRVHLPDTRFAIRIIRPCWNPSNFRSRSFPWLLNRKPKRIRKNGHCFAAIGRRRSDL